MAAALCSGDTPPHWQVLTGVPPRAFPSQTGFLERPGRATQRNATLARPRQEPLPLAATLASHDCQVVREKGCPSDGTLCSKAQGSTSSSHCTQGCRSEPCRLNDLTGTNRFFSLAWARCGGCGGHS